MEDNLKSTTTSVNDITAEVQKPKRQTRAKTSTIKKVERIVPKDIDQSQYITVLNGFNGSLVYKSRRTGETFTWSEFGDEQEIELRELKAAKNSYKKFFENNWFMFDDEFEWVIDYLGVGRFYQYAVKIDEFDEIFNLKASDLKDVIGHLSNGQKKSLGYKARQCIADGSIDSLSVISVLEESLGIDLIEK